jgi:hypothetical protein
MNNRAKETGDSIVQREPAVSANGQVTRLSMFSNAKDTAVIFQATPEQIFDQISSKPLPLQDTIRDLHKKWQAAVGEHGEHSVEAKAIYRRKQSLKDSSVVAFTLSGAFWTRKNDALLQYSNLLQIDLDHLTEKEMLTVLERLKTSPHIKYIWRSISGDGLKAAGLIDGADHVGGYRAFEAHVKELTGKQIDEACKDVSRLCFMSYDPNLWANPNSVVPIPVLEKKNKERRSTFVNIEIEPQKRRAREIAEKLGVKIGDWEKDKDGKWFARSTCADPDREHTAENKTRLYLNPGQVPHLFVITACVRIVWRHSISHFGRCGYCQRDWCMSSE